MGQRLKTILLAAAAGFVLAAAFNNCSRVSSSSTNSGSLENQATGGGGYDGKPYNFHRFDPVRCVEIASNGQPAPNATIAVSPFNQSPRVQLVRDNCAALATPVVLDPPNYQVIPDGSITYNGESYHAEQPNPFAPLGFDLLSPTFQSFWGPGQCVMDSLWNAEIGNGNKVASQRFRAPVNGDIAAVRTFFSGGAGGRGTGGTIRIRLYPDDGTPNHMPNLAAAPLAEAIFVPGLVNAAWPVGRNGFAEINITSFAPLVRGQVYHLYYENTDPNNLQNYISIESQSSGPAHGRPCRLLDPVDWGFLRSQYSVALTDMTQRAEAQGYFVPILQVRTAQGDIFGNSNIDTGNFQATIYSVRSGTPIRERIRPAVSRNFGRFYVHTGSAVAGQLNWALKEGNTILASGSIVELVPQFKVGFLMDVPNSGFYKWYVIDVPPTILAAGRTYDLEFSVADGSDWRFADQTDGAAFGFTGSSAFSESRAERWNGTAWIGFDRYNLANNGQNSHWRLLFQSR